MAFTTTDKSLNKENIFKHLDSYQLFKAYCTGFKQIDSFFSSELRKDSDPSAHIIMWDGDLLYKDFGEERGYRIFDYIGHKYGLDYLNVLQKISADFNLGLGKSLSSTSGSSLVIPEKSSVDLKRIEKKSTIIEIRSRDWTGLDKQYWSQFGIPLKLLEYHNIRSISHYRITNNKKDNALYALNPYMIGYSFDYYWNDNVFRRKLYFPQIKGSGRFIANVDSTIVQGWTLLPKTGKVLFITKSYKDILIFNLLGYWAIAPNNEHSYIPESVMIKLKNRFENIHTWFDNDEGGIKGAAHFNSKFELKGTQNPIGEPKDPSDYVKKYNLKQFDMLVTNFLEICE